MDSGVREVTELLRNWRLGDKNALDRLMPIVYGHLLALAKGQLAAETPGITLSPTALVHEAYLRLVGAEIDFANRAHFYAVSARLFRRILLDHARAHRRLKRGGAPVRVELGEAMLMTAETPDSLIAINDALERLAALDSRKAEIVELLFFGGLEHGMVSDVMNISLATVGRELRMARAWLHNELRLNSQPRKLGAG